MDPNEIAHGVNGWDLISFGRYRWPDEIPNLEEEVIGVYCYERRVPEREYRRIIRRLGHTKDKHALPVWDPR